MPLTQASNCMLEKALRWCPECLSRTCIVNGLSHLVYKTVLSNYTQWSHQATHSPHPALWLFRLTVQANSHATLLTEELWAFMPILIPSSWVKTAFIHSLTHSFNNQVSVEYLLCVRHSTRYWQWLQTLYYSRRNRQKQGEHIITNHGKTNAKRAKKLSNGKRTWTLGKTGNIFCRMWHLMKTRG